jgi:predicted kinase
VQAIIFTGIQASGKSTFYREYFFNTHVRISMDLLKTRNRENVFLNACLETKQRFVVDNTNPTVEERRKYIALARSAGYEVVGYYFQSNIIESIRRNSLRTGKWNIPEKGIRGTLSKLIKPTLEEGYDMLYYVKIAADGGFEVNRWQGVEH